MEEYSDIKTIEDLYNEEEISGKSYLFCVDNDIDTLQDLRKFIAEASSCENIPDDLIDFKSNVASDNKINNIDADETVISTGDTKIDKYYNIYTLSKARCSVRTQNCLKQIELKWGYPSAEYFEFILSNDLMSKIKYIRGAGNKVYDEIKNIVGLLNADKNRTQISINDYINVYKISKSSYSILTKRLLDNVERRYKFPTTDFFNKLINTNIKTLLRETNADKHWTCRRQMINIVEKLKKIQTEDITSDLSIMSPTVVFEQSANNKLRVKKEGIIKELWPRFVDLQQNLSVRCSNVIDKLLSEQNDSLVGLYNYFVSPNFSCKNIKGIGKKSVAELMTFRIDFLSMASDCINISAQEKDVTSDLSLSVMGASYPIANNNVTGELSDENANIQNELWPILIGLKQNLSVRCSNVIEKLINEHNNSLLELYNYFVSSNFSSKDIIGIGEKSGQELINFRREFISIVNDCIYNEGVNIAETVKIAKLENIVCLGSIDIALINTLANTLNRTPLFKLIDCVIKQDERAYTIISNCSRVYNGSKVNVDIVCDTLELTRERVRQLRFKIFYELIGKIGSWAQYFDFSHYKQYCTASWNKNNIFIDEGVDFSDDFIDVVSSVIFKDDYILVGDVQESMLSFYDRKEALFVVPSKLYSIFNFKEFLIDINQRIAEKTYEDYQLDLNHHVLNYFNDVIRFDFVDDIMEYIRLILFEKFQLVVDNGKITLKKNANKSIPEYIENILEENGAIMSLDEIYDEFERKYPGLTKSREALRGSIMRSNRVNAISRSGKYALKEWNSKGVKTGTIKDIIYDYLLGFSTPQSLESIEKYVIQHRPNTDANSIYNNLLLDNRGIFELLAFDDDRFVAISIHEYGDEYINIRENQQSTSRRTFQESMDALYSFVLENQRFPFTSAPSADEMRLGRFLSIVRAKRSNGKLTKKEESILNSFEIDNIDKEISNDQYKWNLRYKELENHIVTYNRLPSSRHEPSLYAWLSKQKGNTNKGLLRNEDAERIKTLLELVI